MAQTQVTQFNKIHTTIYEATDNPNTEIARDFNTPLSPKHRSMQQKINRKTLELNESINQMSLAYF